MGLAFFDEQLDLEGKEFMVLSLQKKKVVEDSAKHNKLNEPNVQLSNFITNFINNFFEAFHLSSSFLKNHLSI